MVIAIVKKIIKNHPNRNRYVLTPHGLWVRDFTQRAPARDINTLTSEDDYRRLVDNTMSNSAMHVPGIDSEHVVSRDVVIVSDGHDFGVRKDLLASLPRGVLVLGTNRSLAKWSPDLRMDWFVTNNPYPDCMSQIPTGSYVPKCIASDRTYSPFVGWYRRRRGLIYRYSPTPEQGFGLPPDGLYCVDDYRNPICAALGLSYRFGVERLLLFCCDDVFAGDRPGAVALANGMFMYPQHQVSHSLIEANLYWLQRKEFRPVRVAAFGSGPQYEDVQYLDEQGLNSFFA